MLAVVSGRERLLAKASGASGRFYYTESPAADFEIPQTVASVLVRFAYCDLSTTLCWVEEAEISLRPGSKAYRGEAGQAVATDMRAYSDFS